MAERRNKHTDFGGAVSGSIMQSGRATSGGGYKRIVDGAGVMLYDPYLAGNFVQQAGSQSGVESGTVLGQWFEPDWWRARGALRSIAQGRGNTWFVESPIPMTEAHDPDTSKIWVLRHYRRGGLMAKLLDDRYRFDRWEQARPWREFELLQLMRGLGLPVPRVVAARVQREGHWYRGDLLTEAIERSYTLASRMQEGDCPEPLWREVGQLIARFHAAGIHHADLNAHNLLISPQGLWLIDFDRGRQRAVGLWCDAVLARLHRSLLKIVDQNPAIRFGDEHWAAVLRGYRDGLA